MSKTIRLLYAETDKAALQPVLEQLTAKGVRVKETGEPEKDDIVLAEAVAPGVYAVDALAEGDIVFFRHEQLGVKATVAEVLDDGFGNETIVGIFPEAAVGRPLSRGVDAMTGIYENLDHNSSVFTVLR